MNNLCRHLQAIFRGSMNREIIDAFVSRIEALYQRNPSICVEKCKELKRLLLHIVDPPMEGIPKSEYWDLCPVDEPAYNSIDGNYQHYFAFSDPFIHGVLKRGCNRETYIKELSSLMRLHSYFPGVDPSQKERDDIRNRIISPRTTLDSPLILEFKEWIPDMLKSLTSSAFRNYVPRREYLPIFSHVANANKSAFTLTSELKTFSLARTELGPYNIKGVLRVQEIRDLYNKFPDDFMSALIIGAETEGSQLDLSMIGDTVPMRSVPLGNIACINEPGNKHRVVASPHLALGSLSFPMKGILQRINSSWIVSGVDSHDDCVKSISKMMNIGTSAQNSTRPMFYSIDVKDWTDRFPYDGIQRSVLENLIKLGYLREYDLHIMDIICKCSYLFLNRGQLVSYAVGTPMGSYPSFPLASLTNGLCAYFSHILATGDRRQYTVPARVIGDDIVIWHDKTAEIYQQLTVDFCMEISTSKTIKSRNIAEMCSKIITGDGVFYQKKIKPINSVSSFVMNHSYYGDDITEVSPESDELLSFLKRVPQPYGLGAPKGPSDPLSTQELYFYLSLLRARLSALRFLDLPAREDFELLNERKRKCLPPFSIGTTKAHANEIASHDKIPWMQCLLSELHVEISTHIRSIRNGRGEPDPYLNETLTGIATFIEGHPAARSIQTEAGRGQTGIIPPKSSDVTEKFIINETLKLRPE